MTIDQQFVEYIIKSLVSDPDAVQVERKVDEKGVLLTLTVAQDDLGRVIGKRGTTAQSIRTLLRALGTKNDARYNLKIVDPNRPDGVESNDARGASAETAVASEDNSSAGRADTEPEAASIEVPRDDATDSVAVDNSTDAVSAQDATPSVQPEDSHDDVVSKTRRELEELDDLDI